MIIDHDSAGFVEILRVSRALFGNQDRLLVASAVASSEPGEIYCKSLAARIGVADSRVGTQLVALEEAGLLVRMPKVGGERRVYYEPIESVFWELVAAFAKEVSGNSVPPTA